MTTDFIWTKLVRVWRLIATQAVRDEKWSPKHLQELAAKHPFPWAVDHDWTWEVIAADGACVGSFMYQGDAVEYIYAAERAVTLE